MTSQKLKHNGYFKHYSGLKRIVLGVGGVTAGDQHNIVHRMLKTLWTWKSMTHGEKYGGQKKMAKGHHSEADHDESNILKRNSCRMRTTIVLMPRNDNHNMFPLTEKQCVLSHQGTKCPPLQRHNMFSPHRNTICFPHRDACPPSQR